MGWKDTAQKFAADPEGFIWGIVLGGIVAGWQAGVGYVAMLGEEFAAIIITVAWRPLAAAGEALQTAILAPYLAVADTITTAALAAGIAAPIAALLGWFIPVVILVPILRLAINMIDVAGIAEDLPILGEYL
jgi:uncharacterized membrane protein